MIVLKRSSLLNSRAFAAARTMKKLVIVGLSMRYESINIDTYSSIYVVHIAIFLRIDFTKMCILMLLPPIADL